MNTNPIPSSSGETTTLAGKMIIGLNQLGTALAITQVTAASMQNNLTAFTTADTTANGARSAQAVAYDAFHVADDALSTWLLNVRAALTKFFGTRWNTMWAQAGYTSPTTAVPDTITDRLGLALRLIGFFTQNPSYEVAPLDVTAAHGTTLRNAAVSTQGVVAQKTDLLKTAMTARDAALKPLTTQMRLLISILTALLGPNDPRWLQFGLNIPGSDTTPAQPVNVQANLNGAAIVVSCDAVPLASRYRFRTLIVGVQSDYVLSASSQSPMASLTGFAPGVSVQIVVQAVNAGRQGLASEPIVVTIPPAAALEPKAESPALEPTALVPRAIASNGHANGHGPLPSSRV